MLYDRQCSKCCELWEVNCKIAEKHSQTHLCPYCDSAEGEWMMGMPATSIRPDRLMTAKKDNGFQEVLAKIQSRNPRTEICKR